MVEQFPCTELIQFHFSSTLSDSSSTRFCAGGNTTSIQTTMTLSSPHEHLLYYYNSSVVVDDDVGSSIISNGGGIIGGELLSTNDNTGRGFAILHRLLASDDAPTVDYAVLGIAVITLGLVLLVEAVRHSVSLLWRIETLIKFVPLWPFECSF
jgi:hypothetical protein